MSRLARIWKVRHWYASMMILRVGRCTEHCASNLMTLMTRNAQSWMAVKVKRSSIPFSHKQRSQTQEFVTSLLVMLAVASVIANNDKSATTVFWESTALRTHGRVSSIYLWFQFPSQLGARHSCTPNGLNKTGGSVHWVSVVTVERTSFQYLLSDGGSGGGAEAVSPWTDW